MHKIANILGRNHKNLKIVLLFKNVTLPRLKADYLLSQPAKREGKSMVRKGQNCGIISQRAPTVHPKLWPQEEFCDWRSAVVNWPCFVESLFKCWTIVFVWMRWEKCTIQIENNRRWQILTKWKKQDSLLVRDQSCTGLPDWQINIVISMCEWDNIVRMLLQYGS